MRTAGRLTRGLVIISLSLLYIFQSGDECDAADWSASDCAADLSCTIQEVTVSWNPGGIIYDGNTYFAYGSRLVTTTPANLRAIMREKGGDGLTFSNEELLHQYLPSPQYGISRYPRIIKVDSKYYMYHYDYYIWASGQWAAFVGRLESTDGYSWSNDVSVLKPNDKSSCDGDWEAGQIKIQDVIYDNGVYHLWYIGTYRWKCVGSGYYPSLGYAESTDGVNFVKRQRILDEDGNFINESHSEWAGIRVLKHDNLYYMLYPKDGDIKYRTSEDGVNWQHRGIFLDNETVSGLIGGSGNLSPGATFEDKDGNTYLYFAFGDRYSRIRLSSAKENDIPESAQRFILPLSKESPWRFSSMAVIKILAWLGLILLPAILVIRDWKYHDRRTRRHHQLTRYILIAWFVLAIINAIFYWL